MQYKFHIKHSYFLEAWLEWWIIVPYTEYYVLYNTRITRASQFSQHMRDAPVGSPSVLVGKSQILIDCRL